MNTGSAPGWLETFGIADRLGTPDLVVSTDAMPKSAHASAIRAVLGEQVDAFLSIADVPTVAFAIWDRFDAEELNRLHGALWNQGLASILVIRLPQEVRVYSLWQRPLPASAPTGRDRRLVEVLDLASEALRVRRLVPAIESGAYFDAHAERFDREARVDATLLSNLKETRERLVSRELPDEIARTLILQTIFIAYLEDRGIIDAQDYQAAIGAPYGDVLHVLRQRDPELLVRLFAYLRRVFNGDVFYAPGLFESSAASQHHVETRHLEAIAEFREGLVELESGQRRFWPYNFRFIPVELISAIYDRFLNQDSAGRRDTGAYFTPRFLADLVVDQVWDALEAEMRARPFTVLDPACGSAVFLVRMFQKMVEEHHRHVGERPSWPDLLGYAERLHGWDIQESAVRIGVFSLYVALLEQVYPPAVRALKAEGKILPPLLGRTLHCRDFFDERRPEPRFDVIVGNPPWVSRRSDRTVKALDWCRRHERPMPGNEIAWAFVWKAAEHLEPQGRVALLLPAMGILLNHSRKVNEARKAWLEGIDVVRIINFADVCFQLFDGADRPTMLALYRLQAQPGRDYEVEYWVPKAHRLLSATRLLIVPSVDRSVIRMSTARRDPGIWKKRMWATDRELKLLGWLGDLPKLGAILTTHKNAQRRPAPGKWVIGQGFKPFDPQNRSPHHDSTSEEAVTRYPFFAANQFRAWVVPTVRTEPWPTATVHRRGFVEGFEGPHVLIPQGIIRAHGFVRAAYVTQSLCFRHSLQAIKFPPGNERRAKVLTAVLNSSLAAWYYFHTSANLGADRAKVHEEQLLALPFPGPDDVPNPPAAHTAEDAIVHLIDELLARKDELLAASDWLQPYAQRADELVFEYYGLTADERTLVNDGIQKVIPSMQPRRDVVTPLMRESDAAVREEYTRTLLKGLREWMRPGVTVAARLMESRHRPINTQPESPDWSPAVLELRLQHADPEVTLDRQSSELEDAVRRIMAQLPLAMSRNLELHPDLKVFIDDSLYLTKPLSTRYWLASTALNDADEIAADLLAAAARGKAAHERRW